MASGKILVTGAAGFIGSHLVESLMADGHTVRALIQPGMPTDNLKKVSPELVQGDIRDKAAMARAVEGVERVFHLAAFARHDVTVPDADYMAVNVEGTRNVLDAARSAGAKRVVFTATIEAVGMSKTGAPLTEDTPQEPRNVYGRTKLEAENLVRDYFKQTGFETVVVRPPMTYGPRDVLLYQRLFKIIGLGFYPLIGSGQALTEFCFVKNQVHGIRLAMERGRPGGVYFISDNRSYSIEEVVKAIASVMGKSVFTPHIPVPVAWVMGVGFEVMSKVFPFYPFKIKQTGRPPFSRKTVAWTSESKLYCDISRARNELGYKAPYDLESGLRETVDWYRAAGWLR